jgi:hypothetical protein
MTLPGRIALEDQNDDGLNRRKFGRQFQARSSPCTMMMPPIMRVDSPMVVHANSCSLFLLRYLMSNA